MSVSIVNPSAVYYAACCGDTRGNTTWQLKPMPTSTTTATTTMSGVVNPGTVYYTVYHLSNWVKHFLRAISIPIVGVANDGVLDDMILLFILSCLVANVCFNCIVQGSPYDDINIGTMWLCALVSCTPSQSGDYFVGVRCSSVERHFVLWYFYDHYFYSELHVFTFCI